MRDSKSLREQAKKIMAEASKLEKKERQDNLLKAGLLCKGFYKKDFADFNPEIFKEEVKKIFVRDGSGEVKAAKKIIRKAQGESPQQEDTAQKKSWFK
ncbi:MAG: hypothetical protein HY279_07650 [Nitrospinae bacterium]|nr:hypothetical protein [Nitrospinota bacterium]